jgi:hypothetical protein
LDKRLTSGVAGTDDVAGDRPEHGDEAEARAVAEHSTGPAEAPVPAASPEPEAGAAVAVGAETAPEQWRRQSEPAAGPVAEPSSAPRGVPAAGRPRGATARLLAIAALIGVVVGTSVGYGVQAGREPTPLAPLSQPGLAYPETSLPESERPEPLSAAEDRKAKTDGDLRDLLLSTPPEAWQDEETWGKADWLSLEEAAETQWNSRNFYQAAMSADLRRIATTSWLQDGDVTEIRLFQFRTVSGARDFAADEQKAVEYLYDYDDPYDDEDGIDFDSGAVEGTSNGRYYLMRDTGTSEFPPLHQARAIVQRGAIVADISLLLDRPAREKEITTLAERQLERL